MRETIDKPLNDGLLEYGQVVTLRDNKTRAKVGESFSSLGALHFDFMSINAKYDSYTVASLDKVDIKVKIYFVSDLQKSHKIKINDELYEIEALDVAKGRRYAYLFLRKVGEWNGQNLIQAT